MSNRASPSYYVTMVKVVVITHPWSLYLICKCNANWKEVLQLLFFIVHEQIKGVHSLLCLAWRRMILYCWLCVRMVIAVYLMKSLGFYAIKPEWICYADLCTFVQSLNVSLMLLNIWHCKHEVGSAWPIIWRWLCITCLLSQAGT